MSFLLEQLKTAGLGWLLEARLGASRRPIAEVELAQVDLMHLGALADTLRKSEVGDTVVVWANCAPPDDGACVTGDRGLDLLRAAAIRRIVSPPGAAVRVDWNEHGLEVAQVALGFGADSLQGQLANRRGLVIADEAVKKVKGHGMVKLQTLKKQELERVLRGSGRAVSYAVDVPVSTPDLNMYSTSVHEQTTSLGGRGTSEVQP